MVKKWIKVKRISISSLLPYSCYVCLFYWGFMGIYSVNAQNPQVNITKEIDKGFSFAWNQQFRKARKSFDLVSYHDPQNKEAQKGLAYVHLYKGNGKKAASHFKSLRLRYPGEPEYQFAYAMALLQQNKVKEAQDSLKQILQSNPGHVEARKLLGKLAFQPAFLEAQLWGGYTGFQNQNSLGIRFMQVSIQPNKKMRFWAKYDNTMSLDNLSFASRHLYAPTLVIGSLYAPHPKLLSRLELGQRFWQNQVRQQLIQGEQVIHLHPNVSLKAGGLYGIANTRTNELMYFLGSRISISPKYSLELIRYKTEIKTTNQVEVRWLANHHFQLSPNFRLTLGGFLGTSEQSLSFGSNWGSHAILNLKLNSFYNLGLLARVESNPEDQFMILSVGMSRKFHR